MYIGRFISQVRLKRILDSPPQKSAVKLKLIFKLLKLQESLIMLMTTKPLFVLEH